MAFTLETQLVVAWSGEDGKRTTWCPKQQVVDDTRFFEFSKWDRGFVRWVTGKSLDLRKNTNNQASADCEFLDKLLKSRQSLVDATLHEVLCQDDAGGESRKRRKRAGMSDSHLCPRVLQFTLPAVGEEGVDELPVQILYDGAGASIMWMEFSHAVSAHLKKGVELSTKKERKGKSDQTQI